MREYVPEVVVRKRNGKFHFMTINLPFYNQTYSSGPDVKTARGGKEEISFYTSDLSGKYIVVVQGVSPEGHAGSTSFSFGAEK